MNKYLAELIGTFWLVLGGCGSAVLAAAFPQLGIGFHGVALAFGLTVLTMAYAIGHISGCHLNPAVSFGLWAGGRFPTKDLVPYVAAQVIGSVAGQVLDGVGAGVRGGDDGDVAVRHHGFDTRQGAGRLCADRHRPVPDADSPGQHSGVGHFGEPGALDRRGAVCADRRAKLVVAVLGGADCGRHDRRGGLQGGGRRSRLNMPHRPTANRRHRQSVAAICYF